MNYSKPVNERRVGWLPWIILVISLCFASIATPAIYGDGREYFLQLVSMAKGRGPAIDVKDVAELKHIQERPGRQLILDYASINELNAQLSSKPTGQGCFYTARDNRVYGCHFFGYSALSVPFFWLLKLLGLNPLNAFIFFNTLLLVGAALFAQRALRLETVPYLITLAVLSLTVGIYYINWPHPEVFSASLAFCACIALFRESRGLAAMCLAIAAWQNPSVILFLIPFGIQDLLAIWRSKADRILQLVRLGLRLLPGAIVFSLPFAFNYWKFGVSSVIASGGYLNKSLISLPRFLSIFIEPNQGLFAWSPIAFFVPALAIYYYYREKGGRSATLQFAAALIACILAALPTLAQMNWNSGSTGPMRYSTWLIVPFLAMATVMTGELSSKWSRLVTLSLAVICFQLLWTIRIAGLPVNVPWLQVQPVAHFFIQHAPRVIPWDAETLYERLLGKESWDGPATFSIRSTKDPAFAALTVARPDVHIVSACGASAVLASPGRELVKSATKAGAAEVLAGAHECIYGVGSSISTGTNGLGQLVLGSGFAQPESWGTWAIGQQSTLTIPLNRPNGDLVITLSMRAFQGYTHLPITVTFNGCQKVDFDVMSDTVKPYKATVPLRCLGAREGELLIGIAQNTEIKLPADLGFAPGDYRRLSVSLSKIEIGN